MEVHSCQHYWTAYFKRMKMVNFMSSIFFYDGSLACDNHLKRGKGCFGIQFGRFWCMVRWLCGFGVCGEGGRVWKRVVLLLTVTRKQRREKEGDGQVLLSPLRTCSQRTRLPSGSSHVLKGLLLPCSVLGWDQPSIPGPLGDIHLSSEADRERKANI